MADDLLTDVKLSSDWEFENTEVIGSISKADLDFINNDDSDIDFYRQANKKLLLGVENKVPVPVIKHNVGKLRINSDSELREKCPNTKLFMVRIFLYSD